MISVIDLHHARVASCIIAIQQGQTIGCIITTQRYNVMTLVATLHKVQNNTAGNLHHANDKDKIIGRKSRKMYYYKKYSLRNFPKNEKCQFSPNFHKKR